MLDEVYMKSLGERVTAMPSNEKDRLLIAIAREAFAEGDVEVDVSGADFLDFVARRLAVLSPQALNKRK